jgi:AAA family ATP:ADP antiporter
MSPEKKHMTENRFSLFFNVERREILPVLLSVAFFFFVLTAIMLLRPAREALGMQRGIEMVRWLFIATAVMTLMVNPVFAFLVSRLKRIQFISITYGFFALSLLAFYLVMVLAPENIGISSGQIFYVWFSVFNLFSTMLFWALMADYFTLEQGKRFFGLIAIGGTTGAIFGPWMASLLATPFGTPALLLISILFLMLALAAAILLIRTQTVNPALQQMLSQSEALIGGSSWQGLRAVFQSRYLAAIAMYVLILAIMATFIYFTRLQMVAALDEDLDMRTTLFARIDMITQIATLIMQALIAGHLMKRLGVALTLALLPITVTLGFIGLAIVSSLATLILFEAAFKAVQRALMRPARETLFTVCPREDKYKAKAFIDTFVYRGGDVAGAQIEGLLGKLGMGLAVLTTVAIPLAALWALLAVWLGRTQQGLDSEQLKNKSL